MGKLIEGRWTEDWYDTGSTGGRFVRKDSQFRDWVRADGSTPYAPEAGRYHLYVSLACPWAHRTLIFRKLKKLDDVISLSVVDPFMGEGGWAFGGEDTHAASGGGEDTRAASGDGEDTRAGREAARDSQGATPESVDGSRFLSEVYVAADPRYTGRVTVPVVWDRERSTIVSNESSEIIRMLNSEFDGLGDASVDFYPEMLREEIDALNEYVYPRINNGVYRCGFATSQEAYEEAFGELFEALDVLDERLGGQRYLAGDRITEADWRLFTTLVRFDAVYVGHFKCNRQRIADYAHLSGYLRELYQVPGVAETVDFTHIKRHYYESHTSINPTGVVPRGPDLDLDTPHGRDAL